MGLDFLNSRNAFPNPNNYKITMFDYENFKKLIFYDFMDHVSLFLYQQCFRQGQMHNIL